MRFLTIIFLIILSSISLTTAAAPPDKDLSSYSFEAAASEFEELLQTQVRRRKAIRFDLAYTLPTGNEATTSISTPSEIRSVLIALPEGEYNFFVEFYRSAGKFRHQNVFITIPATQPAPETATPLSVTLNWVIPSTRENSEPLVLSEIGGYEIYLIGNTAGGQAIDDVVLINDAQQSDYAFQDLLAGDYNFAIATVDSEGLKSQTSEIVSITVQ